MRASSPQAAKMAALPGSGSAGDPRRETPDRSREAHATTCITRPGEDVSNLSPADSGALILSWVVGVVVTPLFSSILSSGLRYIL